MENKLYVVSVYTENQVGLLGVIANIFTRRSLNIETLQVFPSEFEGIHRFTIKTRTTPDQIDRVLKQMEKKVDVIKAFSYVDDEVLVREHEQVGDFLAAREAEYESDK